MSDCKDWCALLACRAAKPSAARPAQHHPLWCCRYTNSTVGAKGPDDFWTNPTTISYYLANAQNIMARPRLGA